MNTSEHTARVVRVVQQAMRSTGLGTAETEIKLEAARKELAAKGIGSFTEHDRAGVRICFTLPEPAPLPLPFSEERYTTAPWQMVYVVRGFKLDMNDNYEFAGIIQ